MFWRIVWLRNHSQIWRGTDILDWRGGRYSVMIQKLKWNEVYVFYVVLSNTIFALVESVPRAPISVPCSQDIFSTVEGIFSSCASNLLIFQMYYCIKCNQIDLVSSSWSPRCMESNSVSTQGFMCVLNLFNLTNGILQLCTCVFKFHFVCKSQLTVIAF